MDPDPNVNSLNKSLSSFEEIATACMGHYKFRYNGLDTSFEDLLHWSDVVSFNFVVLSAE